MKVIVIIPAYNEEKTIGIVIDELRQKSSVDIIVIDDGSKDNTAMIARNKGVEVIELEENKGIGEAMREGYKYARRENYDVAIQVDADGQHNIDYLEKLIEQVYYQKFDMVIGSRYVKKTSYTSSFSRYIGIKYFSVLIYALHRKVVKDTTSGYRAVNKKLISFFADAYPMLYPEVPILSYLIQNESKICEIPVEMRKRQGGKSSIGFRQSIYYFFAVTFVCIKQNIRRRR